MEQTKKQPTFWGNVKALCFGLLVALVLIEIILRIFHPFHFRVQHGKIILPANQKIVKENPHSPKLEKHIFYSRNSIGLRGEEPPADPAKWIKIIDIGGSTTECAYISDSLTWSELLKDKLRATVAPNIWLNNAGLDGTTTSGHIILLRDHVINLHPDYIIFLIGINDTEEEGLKHFDLYNTNMLDWSSPKEWLRSLMKKTEIGSLADNMLRYYRATQKQLRHKVVDYKSVRKIHNDDATIATTIAAQSKYLKGYTERVLVLDSICKAKHIKAIFLTQPTLFASFIDPTTGVDFTDIEVIRGRSAMLHGKVLDQYNTALLNLKNTRGLTVINLAAAMPHDSRYFYDYTHYTPLGTQEVANIVGDSVRQYIK